MIPIIERHVIYLKRRVDILVYPDGDLFVYFRTPTRIRCLIAARVTSTGVRVEIGDTDSFMAREIEATAAMARQALSRQAEGAGGHSSTPSSSST